MCSINGDSCCLSFPEGLILFDKMLSHSDEQLDELGCEGQREIQASFSEEQPVNFMLYLHSPSWTCLVHPDVYFQTL